MYLLLKLLHIASVVAFLGNITTGLFWHAHAARQRDPKLLAYVMGGIIRSDQLFTVPGVVGIIVTGVAAAVIAHFPLLHTAWIWLTLVLFSISGLVFMWQLVPLQRQLRECAATGASTGTFDYERYRALARRWEAWGAVALLTPLAGLVLMVLKPNV
jgi:uncharacterized membrane protein